MPTRKSLSLDAALAAKASIPAAFFSRTPTNSSGCARIASYM
jgi:hypothetical protein